MDPLAGYQAELAKEKAAQGQTVPEVNLLTDQPGAPKPVAPTPPPMPTPPPTPVSPPPGPTPPQRRNRNIILAVVLLLLLVGGGAGGYWYIQNRSVTPAVSPEPNTVAATIYDLQELTQLAGETEVEAGKATNQKKLTLQFTVPGGEAGIDLTPEIEVRPITEAFTGEANAAGEVVKSSQNDRPVSVSFDVTTDGAYHWQARVKSVDKTGEWVVFGQDDQPSFVVDTVAPTAPTITSVGASQYISGVTVNEPKPGFVGTAEPGTKVNVELQPGAIKLTATADSQGAWSATAASDLSTGSYTASVTASDAAGNVSTQAIAFSIASATASGGTTTPPATATPEPEPATPAAPAEEPAREELANTGDNALPVSLLGFTLLALGWLGRRTVRRDEAQD